MKVSERLRFRFLSVLSSGALLGPLGACNTPSNGSSAGRGVSAPRQQPSSEFRAQTSNQPAGSITPTKAMCHDGPGEVGCFDPGTTHFSPGGPTDTPPSNPPAEFDSNRCQVRAQVYDGCCNPAVTGPAFEKGKCCYGFCTGVCCGRPLLVMGEARVAPSVKRADWLESLCPFLTPLAAAERAELAEAWLGDAALEHASIASFARFVLDLLAFGAPAELVEGAERAMGDEIRHARLCFSVAAAYSGEKLGPGPLLMDGVSASSTLAEAAGAAFREGCIGETVAALALEEQARSAELPALSSVLREIANDEANHAELAWRFVRWALSTGGEEVQGAVDDVLRRAAPSSEAPPNEAFAWRKHGRLSRNDVVRVSIEAWQDVILPCARALRPRCRDPENRARSRARAA